MASSHWQEPIWRSETATPCLVHLQHIGPSALGNDRVEQRLGDGRARRLVGEIIVDDFAQAEGEVRGEVGGRDDFQDRQLGDVSRDMGVQFERGWGRPGEAIIAPRSWGRPGVAKRRGGHAELALEGETWSGVRSQ